ncbi:MAG: phosphate ABC transporter permease subunit PstC [Alphaproteobacteria bacterium]|nr:phosphate ABC transporter permease subunit PstC [Alphaproteobacteria bacterium]
MNALTLFTAIVLLSVAGFYVGRSRSLRVSGSAKELHSLPSYYGMYAALWAGIPAIVIFVLWFAMEPFLVRELVISALPSDKQALQPDRLGLLYNDIRNLAAGGAISTNADASMRGAADHYLALRSTGLWALAALALATGAAGLAFARSRIAPALRARPSVERVIKVLLILCSTLAVFVTIGIVLSLIFESIRFFEKVSIFEFLFGLHWSPQTALRADQVGSSGAFGAVPVFAGTLLITMIAMLVAAPVGLMSAIYMSEYATPRVRGFAKPVLEILAGIPTVVFGFFAALIVGPYIRRLGESLGLSVASESALAAGLVMGVMIIPFVSSLSDDVINAVPQTMRDGSYAMGATKSETVKKVIVPAALPGIVGALLLAVSRAIGETMIVVMAAGLAANLTANPFEAVTTVTVQIVTLLVGDQEFDSAKTLAAFALGLVLFCVTLVLNVVALRVVQKYREEYE